MKMGKGQTLYVEVQTTLAMKERIEKDAADPEAVFQIEKYVKHPTMGVYLNPAEAERTKLVHSFFCTFRSLYAAKKYAKKYKTILHKSYWAQRFSNETPYLIQID